MANETQGSLGTELKGRELKVPPPLRGALAAGREKDVELATTSLEFEFNLQIPCGST